jgi:lysophospholipase II
VCVIVSFVVWPVGYSIILKIVCCVGTAPYRSTVSVVQNRHVCVARMPGWFDLYDWPIEVGATDDTTQTLGVGVAAVQSAVNDLRQRGYALDTIVVGGFSQGGAVALLSAYHPTARIRSLSSSSSSSPNSGSGTLSGWLTLIPDFEAATKSNDSFAAAAATPLFWGHGQYDDKVLFEHQAFGVEKLRSMGVQSIDARQYPMGHESDPDELTALAQFVDGAIFGSNSTPSSANDALTGATAATKSEL